MPEARFTIVEPATGLALDTLETEAEAMASLAFPGLDSDAVEIVSDIDPALTAW